tara:strand:- start:54 stop:1931 length:1878 start_codon:yes stop_codon:yes gene_type:complete
MEKVNLGTILDVVKRIKIINQKKYTPLIKEMAKAVIALGLFALLVVIIVGIALAVYFTTKKSSEETPDKPQFTFDTDAKKTINSQEDAEVESYMIEYAEGDDSEKSKLIDLTLSWKNGQGFDSVKKIILTRYVGDTKIQDNKEVEDADMIKDYGSGSVTFKGTEVTESVSVKGKNIIRAYWNEEKEDKLLATAEMEITDDDFSYTVTGPFGEYDVEVSIVGDTFELKKSVKKIYYNLSFNPDFWFKLQINGDGTYTFKYLNGTKPEGTTDKLTMDGIDKFKMKSYKGRQILIHPNDDKKILVISRDGAKFIPESEMTRQDWGRASFTLTAASTITPGDKDYEYLKQGYNASQSYKSPNGNYRLEFQDDGNLVLRDKDDTVMWESKTHGNDNTAKTIVVRGRYNNETNGELVFSKADDLAGGNLILSYGSTQNTGMNYEKPYTLILGDDGILSIIDKRGIHTDALDFISSKGKIKPGDAIKCGDSGKIYRYIGHNQKNHYANGEAASSMHGKHWGNEFHSLDGELCKNTRTGPQINDSVVDDFPKLTYDDKIDLGIGNLCTGSQDKINIMKEKCKNHDTCGGIGQQTNSCWHQFSGKGHRWPKSHGYQKTLNFGRAATSGSHLFRI